ncbi:MAG: ACT domain-containing protein [bacterium]
MFTAKRDHQLVVRVTNEIGVLADLAKVVAEHGINLLAISGMGQSDRGEICFITDDNVRAADALKAHRYGTEQQSVVVLDAEHKPGLLRRVAEKLAHGGIDIERIYASASAGQDRCYVVLHTSDDERALVLLNE